MRDYTKQQKEINKLEDYIRKNKVRAATAAQAKAREKKLMKMDKIEINKQKSKPHFNFKFSKPSWSVILKTKNLVIGYDKALTKPLDLKMSKNEKIVIIGANGIGKTTLLNILGGIDRDYQGEIHIEDRNLRTLKQEAFELYRNSVSYVFQNSYLFGELTVLENLRLINDCEDRIRYFAKQLGILDLLDHYPIQLSGGRKTKG